MRPVLTTGTEQPDDLGSNSGLLFQEADHMAAGAEHRLETKSFQRRLSEGGRPGERVRLPKPGQGVWDGCSSLSRSHSWTDSQADLSSLGVHLDRNFLDTLGRDEGAQR